MNKFHRPLNIPKDRQALIEKAAAVDDGCLSVGGFASKLGQLRRDSASTRPDAAEALHEVSSPLSGVAGIARLVQLARREARLSLNQFAEKIGVGVQELAAVEVGTSVPEPRVIHALSSTLGVSYQKLMSLAGHRRQRDEALEREVLKFAASSGSMDKLSKVEAQALQDLLRILHD